MNRRLLLLVPFGATVAAGAGFFAMLRLETQGKFDPRGVPSMLIGKHVPPFTLPGESGFSDADLAGKPILVNFFASWCVPCVEEAQALMGLKQAGASLYGIVYKDKPDATAAYLARHGNPYARIGRDDPGRVAIDWGVTGVPETYLIDKHGIVRSRWVGPLTEKTVSAEVQPLLRQYA
jgi:cytochrome c biogenesis protein CcmG/thiol:disulfide interchange protein DsbE